MLAPLQKLAWFNLLVFCGTLLVYLIAVPILAQLFHRTITDAAIPSMGIFGLLGFWGLGVKFLRNSKNIPLDERDQLIYRQAIIAGWSVFWFVFVAVCMSIWAAIRYSMQGSTIPVDLLPCLVLGGMIVAVVTQSIVILVQYGRSHGDE